MARSVRNYSRSPSARKSMAATSAIQTVIDLAARRALRHSLVDFGCEGAELREMPCDGKVVYYVPRLRRLVWVGATILPQRPAGLAGGEARQVLTLERGLEAEPWQALVLLRPTFLPQAVVWLRLEGSRPAKV